MIKVFGQTDKSFSSNMLTQEEIEELNEEFFERW